MTGLGRRVGDRRQASQDCGSCDSAGFYHLSEPLGTGKVGLMQSLPQPLRGCWAGLLCSHVDGVQRALCICFTPRSQESKCWCIELYQIGLYKWNQNTTNKVKKTNGTLRTMSAAQGDEENGRIVNFPNTESVPSIDRMTNSLENSHGCEGHSGKNIHFCL